MISPRSAGRLRRAIGICLLAAATVATLGDGPRAAAQEVVGSGGLQIVEHSSHSGPAGTIRIGLLLPGVFEADDSLSVTIHEPVNGEAQFLATTTGQQLGGILDARLLRVGDLTPSTFGRVDLIIDLNPQDGTIPSEPGQVRLVRPGVYPLTIELRTVDQDLVGRLNTHIIRLPDATQPSEDQPRRLPVVLVTDIAAADDDPLADTLAARDRLTSISAHTEVAVTATAEPELLEALDVEVVDDVPVEFIRGPFFDVDEASMRAAGLTPELDELFARGDAVTGRVGIAAPETLWVDHGTADRDLVEALHARGVRDAVLRPDALVDPPSVLPRRPVEVDADGVSMRALLVDSLAPRQPHDSPVSAAQRAAAHLAAIAFFGSESSIVTIDLDRDAPTTDDIDAFLTQLAALPLVDTQLASAALGAPLALSRVQLELAARPEDATTLTGYRDAANRLAAYRSMVRDEDAERHDRLSQELFGSLAADNSDAERAATWDRITDFVAQQTSLVDAPPAETISLTSRRAVFPFSFQNRAETALRVEVRVISDKLRVENFDDGESTTLVLEPGVTTHEFDLHALRTGSFPITIELYSPDGGIQLSTTRAALRSTTPTGVGLALTVGAAVFLVLWWIADLRRKRRA